MYIEVLGYIDNNKVIVDRLEPIDEYLQLEYDDTRFSIIIKCKDKDKISKVIERATKLVERAVR